MKHLSILSVAVIVMMTVSLAACSGSTNKEEKKDTTSLSPMHGATAMYACPMHPEVTSDKPGQCSKCGMDLVKKEIKH
jgi:ABC-type uncharacterized transport system auxiliary subunit